MDGWMDLAAAQQQEGKAGKEAEEAEAEEAFRNTFSLQRNITSAAAARERCMPKNGKRREREHSERRRSLKCFEVFV